VNEDPVTGSAHCELAPYWAEQLGKSRLTGRQLSKRSGLVECEMNNDRVTLIGTAIDYLHGQITIKKRF
jgi:predicted PhzF superfamily epimerase YddE/YHI9